MESYHKFTRRKFGHDYKSPCHYHIIIKKNPDYQKFGTVRGDASIKPGNPGAPYISLTEQGQIISKNIFNLDKRFPQYFKTYQFIVMPDHIHIFLKVKDYMEKALGYYINGLKAGIAKEISFKQERKILPSNIFQPNYTDRIIYKGFNYHLIIDYIRENPYRLAVRKQIPYFFQRKYMFWLDGIKYEAYGNLMLMKNPFKMNIHLSDKCTQEEFEILLEEAIHVCENGGVMVSPFISGKEKLIRATGIKAGGKIIRITNKPLLELYKPGGEEFELCTQGRFLIIAPLESMGEISREVCRKMNGIASLIAGVSGFTAMK